MSELTPCNFCSLKRLKNKIKRGQRLRVVPAKDNEMGGFNVYIFHAGETIDHDRHFVSWMWEISHKCAC